MLSRTSRRHVIITLVSFVLLLMFSVSAVADVLLPEASGTKMKRDGSLTVDCSHMDEGYIMVKGPVSKKRLKVRIKTASVTLNYDLNTTGEYEVYPLQFGSGKYQVALYKNASGNKYSEEGKVTINADMDNELSCFLYPNQYVNYGADSIAVKNAADICQGMTNDTDKFEAVCGYMKANFQYDFIKSVTVAQGTMPDIDGTIQKRMGICQDLAAVMVCMLRSQGIPARLMIGTVGSSNYHAWVTAVVDGKDVFFDPTAELNASPRDQQYTTERYY